MNYAAELQKIEKRYQALRYKAICKLEKKKVKEGRKRPHTPLFDAAVKEMLK